MMLIVVEFLKFRRRKEGRRRSSLARCLSSLARAIVVVGCCWLQLCFSPAAGVAILAVWLEKEGNGIGDCWSYCSSVSSSGYWCCCSLVLARAAAGVACGLLDRDETTVCLVELLFTRKGAEAVST
ncbi:hypothetical protein KY290_024860 [Solanum tuberosum]|uniref:Uncharacterized protein n=1 Tax=Solanum tuberosum TaxID=4113 RepID=A0ABQ7URW6_SOLTU|nr:hypothetical protein KY284_023718 [Solanum tuberosum]KAH0754590.1 hypothetical protein KY290_024860 [Solanum tuberosum]